MYYHALFQNSKLTTASVASTSQVCVSKIKNYVVVVSCNDIKWKSVHWDAPSDSIMISSQVKSSGLWRHVVLCKDIIVLKDLAASIFILPWRLMQQGPLKCWYPATTLLGITTQNTSTWNFTSMKTSTSWHQVENFLLKIFSVQLSITTTTIPKLCSLQSSEWNTDRSQIDIWLLKNSHVRDGAVETPS